MVNPDDEDESQMVDHCTAFNDRYFRHLCDTIVVVESFPPKTFPVYPIDISIYRMRHPLEVSLLF